VLGFFHGMPSGLALQSPSLPITAS
jgi:hypothetical protein